MKLCVDLRSDSLSRLREMVSKLNKKATKLGMPEITYTTGESYMVETRDEHDRIFRYRKTPVVVTGEVPVIDGWVLLSQIEYLDAGNIVNVLSENYSTPEEFWARAPFCDHCSTRRVKKYSFVIHNPETGEYKQVGKTCLKDFFSRDIEAYLRWIDIMGGLRDEFADEDSEWFGFGGGCPTTAEVRDVFAITLAQVKNFGYVKAAAWDEVSEQPTKVAIQEYFFCDPPKDPESLKAWRKWTDTLRADADYETADAMIEQIRNASPWNEFMHNVKILVLGGEVRSKNIGYIVGYVPSYLKIQEKELAKKNFVTYAPEYVGEPRQRREFEVVVMKRRVFDGYYGASEMLEMADDNNHCLVWFNSGSFVNPEIGEKLKIKGTVKKHNKYNEIFQTVLSRVAVLS